MTRAPGPRALAPARPEADPRLAAAERRRAQALAEVDALDAEVERLANELAAFSARYDATMAKPFSELSDAERLVRRLQTLEDELARLGRVLEGTEPRSRGRGRTAPRRMPVAPPVEEEAGRGEGGEDVQAVEVEVLSDEAEVKRLHRRLARMLHPDLAADGEERGRLAALMAEVNAAYTRGDRSALELLAERAGAGDLDADVSLEERVTHLGRRADALGGVAAALRRERDGLLGSATGRLWREAVRREKAGHDLVGEMRRDIEAEAASARDDARRRLVRVAEGAAEVGRRWRSAMAGLVLRGRGGLRPFDPVMESPLVRRGVLELERARAGPAARELARRLEEAAPWEAAAVLLAYFAEAAGRPPEALASPDGWRDRWDLLRERWPESPDFERLLARLPRTLGLEVGIRAASGRLAAGLQLSSADLLPGVRIALERESVASVARAVLATLGPRARCSRCRRQVVALHLLRTRGLDEVHGLACPRCGAILRSYWRYGEVDGLEALAPLAGELGVVAERAVRFAGSGVAFQLLPVEAERLTAARLLHLFEDLYLTPCQVDLPRGAIGVRVGRRWLGGPDRVPERGAALDVRPGRAVPSAGALLETLRARVARRFRAEPPGGVA